MGVSALAVAAWFAKSGSQDAARAATFPLMRSDEDWRARLGSDQYAILRRQGTERPGSSPLDREVRSGRYDCAGCEQPLFTSAAKFDSRTGWPSFWESLPAAVVTVEDRSLLMTRIEALCSNCGGHLGHVFNDGPKPTGVRYCMNGVALSFRPGAA